MVTLIFRYIFFLTLFHSIYNDRDALAKYKGYLILEKILNASIVYYNNSIVPLLNVEGHTETISYNSETTNLVQSSTPPSRTTKLGSSKLHVSTRTVFYNIDDLNTTSSVYEMASIILKNTTGPYAIITNKTDVHNTSRPIRRTNDKLDAIMAKLDGGDEREELFYEPFWKDGEFVFKRTGTKQERLYEHQLDEYRDCDRHCSVFEGRWYGRVCAARRDSFHIDILYKNFSSMCMMESENCRDPTKRPGMYRPLRVWCGPHSEVCALRTIFDRVLH